MRRATPTSGSTLHPHGASMVARGLAPRIACDLATRWQRGGVIAVCDAIATCGAFGELQREGVAGRGVVASPAGVSRRGASRESRGAARLTRAARAETTTFLAVASTMSLRARRARSSFSQFLVDAICSTQRKGERVAVANGRSVRWRGVTSVSRSRDLARRSMGSTACSSHRRGTKTEGV